MKRIANFDVLIVYSEKLANSANSSGVITAPFPKGSKNESYNLVYSYFLKTCQKNNLKAAFTTSADIIGAGKCRSYWLYENEAWIKVKKTGFSKCIFDKFSPASKSRKIKRNLLFSSKQIKPFNNSYLFNLCFDKQKTYEALKRFSIPTVVIKGNTKQDSLNALKILKEKIAKHKNRTDFSEEVVLKNRFGAGGLNVYKFKSDNTEEISSLIKNHRSVSFIIQPFVKFDKGFFFNNSSRSADIRLIFLGRKIVQTYVRIAEKGNFICNEHAGGLLKYISKIEIPLKVREVSKRIADSLNYEYSLFALDFIISNDGNIYLLEANTKPGLDWNLSLKENEIEAKKLIRIIIKEISRRASLQAKTTKKKVVVRDIDIPLISANENPQDLLINQII